MSGGSLDYAYCKIEEVVSVIRSRATTPVERALIAHLLELMIVLRDLEWAYSGDSSLESVLPLIEKFLGPTTVLEQAIADAKKAKEELEAALKKAKKR